MQLIVPTAKKVAEHIQKKNFRPTELWEPPVNLRMGTWYLAQLTHKFGGNILLAAAAYNAGPHFVVAWTIKRDKMPLDEFVEEIFHTETRHYVKRVFQSYAMYSYLYRDRMPAILPPIKVEKSNKIDF
jgi:soluble lytic murein transglycosylase